MVGLTVANDHLVAVLVAVPSMISAAVGVLVWRANGHAREAADSVRPNGQGTIVEIGEKILAVQKATQTQLQSLQVQQISHEARDDTRFSELAARIDACEVRHADD